MQNQHFTSFSYFPVAHPGTWTRIAWNDRTKQLTIEPAAPKGATNVTGKRVFRLLLLPEGTTKDVTYAGVRMQTKF